MNNSKNHHIEQYRLLYILLCLIFSLSYITPAHSEEPNTKQWLDEATENIKKQELYLKQASADKTNTGDLSKRLSTITPVKNQAQSCITNTEKRLTEIEADLLTLGEVTTKEPADVSSKRKSLSKEKKNLDKQLASCKLILIQSIDLTEAINDLQQSILAQQLSAKTPHIISVITDNLKSPVAGWEDSIDFLRSQYKLKLLSAQQLGTLILLAIFAAIAGIHFGRLLSEAAARSDKPSDSVSAFILATRTSLAPALPYLLPLGIAATFLSFILPLTPIPFITKVSYVLGSYLSLIVLINILLSPVAPASTYLARPGKLSRRLAKHLKIFLSIGVIGFLVLSGEFKDGLSEHVYYLSRSVFSIIFIINLIAILWIIRLFSWTLFSRTPHIFLTLVLLVSLVSDLLGYRNLSFFILGGVIATSVSLALTMLVYRLLKDLCDGLDEGRLRWEVSIRQRLGLKKSELVPGMIWIRIIIFIGLWGGFAITTLHIWKLDDPWVATITEYLTVGFSIGSLNFTPTLLVSGILTFALILHLTRYIKNRLLPQGLKYTKLDRGAKEAVTSLTGYAGVAIAILIGLSISGVEMQNIAIIAGALSVGIGFGLQNIVNNFISGLILLFERPIRSGDWIITGETEGYVKAINIRSTRIETFEKADVIVPNSELITAKVTNWVLKDNMGRISVPIGVGYGSDAEKVHNILINIARNHPSVIKDDSSYPDPKVLFRSFGDSALNFELRCFIYDIDHRLNVISEINFAINKVFKEEEIEIPFPQRVVTLHKNGQSGTDSNSDNVLD